MKAGNGGLKNWTCSLFTNPVERVATWVPADMLDEYEVHRIALTTDVAGNYSLSRIYNNQFVERLSKKTELVREDSVQRLITLQPDVYDTSLQRYFSVISNDNFSAQNSNTVETILGKQNFKNPPVNVGNWCKTFPLLLCSSWNDGKKQKSCNDEFKIRLAAEWKWALWGGKLVKKLCV